MPLRSVYTDLDGSLLGRGGSLFHDAEGEFTLLGARGLEACHRAGVEIVLYSGRRRAQVMEDARLMGQTAYIFEVGCGLTLEGETRYLTGDVQPTPQQTVHEQVEAAGAPGLLLEAYADRLERHTPWHGNREFSHLFRGLVDEAAADALLSDHGHQELRLVDNGTVFRSETTLQLEGLPHAYHLIPRPASKGRAVAEHMRARRYRREECIAVGDSREDLGVAEFVSRFFLVANAVERDPEILAHAPPGARVEVTEARNGEGFYEAVVRSLAEGR